MRRGSYSRWVALALAGVAVAVVALAVTSAGADYGGTTKAPKDCQFPRVKPDRIVITCADFGAYVDHIKWTSWRPDRAGGHGHFHEPGAKYPAKVRLSKPQLTRCNGRRVMLFQEMKLRFPHRKPPDARQFRDNQLFCIPSKAG